jgi:hypothetical protein
MYLVLFAAVMVALGGSFMAIKMRQNACRINEKLVNARMTEIQEAIKEFEQLQTKRKEMMKTALTTAELLEPVPRSILLASLTNTLPPGVSLLELHLIQKQPKQTAALAATSKYKAAQARKGTSASNASQQNTQTRPAAIVNPEKFLETHIGIGGTAPSDLQVAAYIKRLSVSSLLDNVALVESREFKVDTNTFRQFKLTAMLRKNVHLSKEDVEKIRTRAENTVWNF